MSHAVSDRIDRLFEQFDRPYTPGVNVAVLRDGAVVHRRAYGRASLEHDVPWTPDTPTRIASVTKQFAAALLLRLSNSGVVSLDDDVRRYVPELPDYGRRITLLHLLTNRSGMRVDEGLAWLAGRALRAPARLSYLHELIVRQRGLNFVPGRTHQYCDTGFRLAALIAERVTGRSIDLLSREELFEPLGMMSTSYAPQGELAIPRLAQTYTVHAASFHRYVGYMESTGDGGLISTQDDLLRWAAQLLEPRIGGSDFTQHMTTMPADGGGRDEGFYALGLRLGRHRGSTYFGHTGGGFAYTALHVFPAERLAIVCLANRDDFAPALAPLQIFDALYPERIATHPAAAQAAFHAAGAAPEDTAELAGLYADAEAGLAVEVAIQGDIARLKYLQYEAYLRRRRAGHWVAEAGSIAATLEVVRTTHAGAAQRIAIDLGGARPLALDRVVPRSVSPATSAQAAGTYFSEEVQAALTLQSDAEGCRAIIGGGPDDEFHPVLAQLTPRLLWAPALCVKLHECSSPAAGVAEIVPGLTVSTGLANGIVYRRLASNPSGENLS